MIDKIQLRSLTEKVLRDIGLHSEDAVNLVLGTIAQESKMGTYIKQLNNGPALGICQMEPNTLVDILGNYLYNKEDLHTRIKYATHSDYITINALEYNLALAIAMCRVHYLRVPEPLPITIAGYAAYWKKYYNTPLGKGTEAEFITNYYKYV